MVGDLHVKWRRADAWEPRPPWGALRQRAAGVDRLRGHVRAAGPGNRPWPPGAVEALQAGWAGDQDALRRAARSLAGRGAGLTPSGDDALVGAMLRAHLDHPDPLSFCGPVVDEAAPRTTLLSAAFLRAAARGECSAAWHHLLHAVTGEHAPDVDTACLEVLSHGATSGADMVLGFLIVPGRLRSA